MDRSLLSVLMMMTTCVSVAVSLTKCHNYDTDKPNLVPEWPCTTSCMKFTGTVNGSHRETLGCSVSGKKEYGCRPFDPDKDYHGPETEKAQVRKTTKGEMCYCNTDLCNDKSFTGDPKLKELKCKVKNDFANIDWTDGYCKHDQSCVKMEAKVDGKQITVAGCYEGSKQKDGFCRDVKKEDITYKNKKHPKTVEGKVCFCNKDLCNGKNFNPDPSSKNAPVVDKPSFKLVVMIALVVFVVVQTVYRQ